MADRRQFLTTLGKMLGGSLGAGFLLPHSGSGALALAPGDLGKAAQLPVRTVPLPFSAECLQLRRLKQDLFELRQLPDQYERSVRWQVLSRDHYRPLSVRVANRPTRSWTDCVELAEIAWHTLPKRWEVVDDRHVDLAALDTTNGDHFMAGAYHCRQAIAALVEATLTLGGGERFDPRLGDRGVRHD